jgi:hypothetical protein
MANTFYRKLSRNVGNTAVTIGSYTVGSGNTAIVLGLTICNTTGSAVNADVALYINSLTESTFLVKDAPIPGGGSLVVVGGDQKVVLQEGDAIQVESSTTTSLDVIMSIMEIS